MSSTVTRDDVRAGIHDLGVDGLPLCVHSSLRSFGRVERGADTVVDGILDEGCTLLVPTFSYWLFLVAPPESMRPGRNGWDYGEQHASPGAGRTFSTESDAVSQTMGAIPKAVLARPGRVRGRNPICSFAALGPVAARLVSPQRALDVYPPLRVLAASDGWVVLMGVGLERMTLIHLAEERAGRTLFRRWANGPDGKPMEVEVGGCSEGFGAFEPVLAPLARETTVGESRWRAFPARQAIDAAAAAIRERPQLTACGRPGCLRCADAIAGGPSA